MRMLIALVKKVLFLIYCLSFIAHAQINNFDFKVELIPENLGVCNDNTSKEVVKIIAKKGSLSNFEIQFQLPEGVYYVQGSANIQTGANYSATEKDISNLNQPILSISNGATWNIGDEVVVEFLRSADCDAVYYLNNGFTFKDKYAISYTGGTEDYAIDHDVTVNSYQLLAASLSLREINTLTVNIGDTITRDITIEQGGNGEITAYTHYITLEDDIIDYELSFNDTTLSPTTISNDTLFYNFDLASPPFTGNYGDNDLNFENGETLVFTETFKAIACEQVAIKHHAYWSCSGDEQCQQAEPRSGGLAFEGSTPQLEIIENHNIEEPEICGATHYEYTIKNIETSEGGNAFDIYVNIGLGANTIQETIYENNPLYSFLYSNTRTIDNLSINNHHTPFQAIASTFFPERGNGNTLGFLHDYFTSNPDGDGGLEDIDGDGFFDDLAYGDSIVIAFDFFLQTKTSCGEGYYEFLDWENVFMDINYRNQCKSSQIPERKKVNYVNLIRDPNESSSIASPTDVTEGIPFEISFTPYLFESFANVPFCNGKSLTGIENDSVLFEIVVLVPKGIGIDPVSAANPDYDNTTIQFKTGAVYDSVIYTKTSYFYGDQYTIPLNVYDASNFSDGAQVSLSYFTRIKCLPCFSLKTHCGNIPDIRVHIADVCLGPKTLSFDSKRTSAGWTDHSKNTKVTLDENIHHTDYYLPYDTMQIDINNIVSGIALDELFLELQYLVETGGGDENLLSFVDGQIVITDGFSGTSKTGTIINAPTSSIGQGGSYSLMFDLSSYTDLISGNYSYGGLNDIDSVKLSLRFLLTDNFEARRLFELEEFRASAFYYDSDGVTKIGCSEYGDRVFYNKQEIDIANHVANMYRCEEAVADQFFANKTETGDLFPNEYRPMFEWDSTVIEIPSGVTIGDVVTVSGAEWQGNKLGINYDTTYHNERLVIKRGENFLDPDMNVSSFARFRLGFTASCESQIIEDYQSTFYFKEFAYSGNKVSSSITNENKVTFSEPDFLVQAVESTFLGSGVEAEFDLFIENVSVSSIPYNWVLIKPNTNITINKVALVQTNDDTTSLPLHTHGDSLWVEMGNLDAHQESTIRFYVNYTDCDNQEIIVKHGWNCTSYPTMSNISSYCYRDSVSFFLNPKEAQVQLKKLSEPSSYINRCDPFEVSLEINSAQVADLFHPLLKMSLENGANGLFVDSILVEYPKNSGDIQSIVPNIVNDTFNIDITQHTAIEAIQGIYGTDHATNKDERAADVSFHLKPGCNFQSNTSLIFEVFGYSPCGSKAVGDGTKIATSAIIINGAEPPYIAFSTLSIPNNDAGMMACDTQTVSINTIIKDGTTGATDSAKISLPEGIHYVEGTFNCSGTCITLENTTYINGRQTLYLKLPENLASDGTLNYTFNVKSTTLDGCNLDGEIDLLYYVNTSGVSCTGYSCQSITVPTESVSKAFPVFKPNIELQHTSNANVTIEGHETTIEAEITLYNKATLYNASEFEAIIYALDNNFTKTEDTLGGYTFSTNLHSGDSTTVSLQFSSDVVYDYNKGIFLELFNNKKQCFCEAPNLLLSTEVSNNNLLEAKDDTISIPIGVTGVVNFDLIENDLYEEGGNITSNLVGGVSLGQNTSIITTPKGATVRLNRLNGEIQYVLSQEVTGIDSIQYYIEDYYPIKQYDTATAIFHFQELPPLSNTLYDTTYIKTDLSIAVLNGKVDPNHDAMHLDTLTLASRSILGGNISYNALDETITFTPSPYFLGDDRIVYQVCDTTYPSNLCTYDTVYIHILDQGSAPIQQNKYLELLEDHSASIHILEDNIDPDGEDIYVQLINVVSNKGGALSYSPSDSIATYTPAIDFIGSDWWVYEVCDNPEGLSKCTKDTLFINVIPQRDTLSIMTTERDDTTLCVEDLFGVNFTNSSLEYCSSDSLLYSDLTHTEQCFTLSSHTLGNESFCTYACNDGLCDSLIIMVEVNEYIGIAPQAEDDYFSVHLATISSFDPKDNDEDPDTDKEDLNIYLCDTTTTGDSICTELGAVVELTNGVVYYHAPENKLGKDAFQYILCDQENLCDTANIEITILDLTSQAIIVTPDNDDINDFLISPGYEAGEEIPNSEISIFNRWGNRIFHAENYFNNWNGQLSTGGKLPFGTYFFILHLKNEDRKIVNYVFLNN